MIDAKYLNAITYLREHGGDTLADTIEHHTAALRREAARYRTRLREAEARLEQATTAPQTPGQHRADQHAFALDFNAGGSR